MVPNLESVSVYMAVQSSYRVNVLAEFISIGVKQARVKVLEVPIQGLDYGVC